MADRLSRSGGDRSIPGVEKPHELTKLTTSVLRGMGLSRPDSVNSVCDHVAETDEKAIPILSKCIPHKFGYEHILVLGASGSGKTTCVNQVLQDCLWHVGKGYGHRVFIWDYKRTARRYLENLPLKVPVYYLDIADERSHGIDWARQIDTDFAAKQFAKLMVHGQADPGGHNFVFTANARSTLYHVIRTFQRFSSGRWDMTDVVNACADPDNLKCVLDMTPRGRAKRKTVFGARDQGAGVFFSLEEFVSDFGPIASVLSKIDPMRRITLQDFLKSESVLVLGHHERVNEALLPFQRWVFGTLVRELLSQPDIGHDGQERTSFFLDEVRNSPFIGRDLSKLLNSGRSKGGVVVTGLGDIAGLKDAIGENKAEEFLSMHKTKVFLRLDGPAATWVSEKYFGKHLRLIRKFSEGESVAQALGVNESWQQERKSRGTSESHTTTPSRNLSYEAVERPTLYPGDFQKLHSPRYEAGAGLVVRAYMAIEGNVWKECSTHTDKASFKVDEKVEDIRPRPNSDFNTDEIEWSKDDLERLGLVQKPEAKPRVTAFDARKFAAAGGLMSYGTNIANAYRQAGITWAAFSKGTRPLIFR